MTLKRYLYIGFALVTVLFLPLLLVVFMPAAIEAATDTSMNLASNNIARETTKTAKIEPSSGPVGTEVTVTGSGFRVGEDGVTITYDGMIIKCNIAADGKGSWETTVQIPPSTKGRHTVGVYGSSFTPIGIVRDNYFDVIPGIDLVPKMYFDPATKITTTELTVMGTGFAEGESVNIGFDNNKVAEATVDISGSFSTVFEAPGTGGKEHVVSAADSSGSSAQATYFMEKSSPQPPQLMSPVSEVRIEILSSPADMILGPARYLASVFGYLTGSPPKSLKPGLATFVWKGTAESSNGSYVLHIDRNYDFSSPALVKTGLGNTSYMLSADDVLTPGTYYWRVKAVDDTGDESEWSESRSFQVIYISNRALTTYVVGTMVLFGIVVIALLVFLVNRPTK